jgi:hypothetical protein
MPLAGQVGELDRGRTYAPKFPGAARRDFTRNRVKTPKIYPANCAKRPKIFQRYAPEDSLTTRHFHAHILGYEIYGMPPGH